MIKAIFSGAVISMFTVSMAYAQVGNANPPSNSESNSEAATSMANVLSETPGIGSAASLVSGNDPAIGEGRSASGWGNTGSAALSEGGQVSRGKGN